MGMEETVIVHWFENSDGLGGDWKAMVLDGLMDRNGLAGLIRIECRFSGEHRREKSKELDCL